MRHIMRYIRLLRSTDITLYFEHVYIKITKAVHTPAYSCVFLHTWFFGEHMFCNTSKRCFLMWQDDDGRGEEYEMCQKQVSVYYFCDILKCPSYPAARGGSRCECIYVRVCVYNTKFYYLVSTTELSSCFIARTMTQMSRSKWDSRHAPKRYYFRALYSVYFYDISKLKYDSNAKTSLHF